jgi:hypothetical protein
MLDAIHTDLAVPKFGPVTVEGLTRFKYGGSGWGRKEGENGQRECEKDAEDGIGGCG